MSFYLLFSGVQEAGVFCRSHDISKPVYRALAYDRDLGNNGHVSYSLADPDASRWWRIDSLTGELYLLSDWPQNGDIIVRVSTSFPPSCLIVCHPDLQLSLVFLACVYDVSLCVSRIQVRCRFG